MPSIFTLEGPTPRPQPVTILGQGLGDNALLTWMKQQSLPVAAATTAGLSLGIGFVLATVMLKLLGRRN